MKRTKRLPWKRLLAEFTVIVIGVLVALAADEWMDDLETARAERAYMEAVEGELWYLIGSWEFARGLSGDRIEALDLLEDELAGRQPSDPATGWYFDLAYVVAASPLLSSAGEVEGPILSGDPQLRRLILRIAARADEAVRAYDRHLERQLSQHDDMDVAFPAVGAMPDQKPVDRLKGSPEVALQFVRRARRTLRNQNERMSGLLLEADQLAEELSLILGSEVIDSTSASQLAGSYRSMERGLDFSVTVENSKVYTEVRDEEGRLEAIQRLRPTGRYKFEAAMEPEIRIRFEFDGTDRVDGAMVQLSLSDSARFERR